MLYAWLADLVVVLHFAFIVFVIGGGLLAWRRRWVMWLHLPAMAWGGYVTLAGRLCPLTPLEQALRRRGGDTPYTGDFVEEYVMPLVYAGDVGREVQVLLGALLLVVNGIVYAAVWRGRHTATDTRPREGPAERNY